MSEWDQEIRSSLNPCSSGRYSASSVPLYYLFKQVLVLILVLVEDTLREYFAREVFDLCYCLNPCSSGRYSARILLKICSLSFIKS